MVNYSWKRAIRTVLEEDGGVLRSSEIAEIIQERQLRDRFGTTPAQTIAAVISGSIKRDGELSPFVRVAPGQFTVRSSGLPRSDAVANGDDEEQERQVIRAFGIFWRRDWVNWNVRCLNGSQLDASNSVDFAEQSGVYILYDRDRPIYVGKCAENSLFDRLKSHTKGRLSSRWERFSWFGFRAADDDGRPAPSPSGHVHNDMTDAMEAVLIEVLEPPQNRRRGDRLSDFEYNQVRDEAMQEAQVQRMILSRLGIT